MDHAVRRYGDLAPRSTLEMVFASLFMPLATAALAFTVHAVREINVRSEVIETNFELVADRILAKAADGDVEATLTEEAFLLQAPLLSVIVRYCPLLSVTRRRSPRRPSCCRCSRTSTSSTTTCCTRSARSTAR